MTSVGVNRETGEILAGWDHVRQSISVILSTEVGERVHRRPFGSSVTDLIDRPQNHETIMDFYMAVAEALEARIEGGIQLGEPRFSLTSINVTPSVEGSASVEVYGDYFPRGHLGDFTRSFKGRSIRTEIGAIV